MGRAVVLFGALALVGACSSPAATTSGTSPSATSPAGASSSGAQSVTPSSGSSAPPSAPTESTAPSATVSVGASEAPGSSAIATDPQPSHPASGGDALPTCAYKDLPAVGDPDTDWATMVLDTIYRLPADFAPRKVVSTSKAGMQTGFEVIPAVIDDLDAMHRASAAAGNEIAIRWAYRSYGQQQGAFAYWVQQSGKQAALQKSARPGHSEHQLGTAIDFRSADSLEAPWDYPDWATTGPGAWMMEHAWSYGFVLSYPKGDQDLTCYAYEPWHYRYVGRDLAAQIHASGLTPREFLWRLAHP